MVEPIRITETVINTTNKVQDLGIDLIPVSSQDQERLNKRQNDFVDAKYRISTILEQSTPVMDQQSDPMLAKL